MKKIKQFTKFLIAVLTLCFMISTSMFAAELPKDTNTKIVTEGQLTIRYVTPEEMNRIIALSEAGITPADNWFADNVLFTITREENGNARAVFYKLGMVFDGCTLSGIIRLHTSSGMVVASHEVNEADFMSYTSRVRSIHPAGGSFSYVTYNLSVSDGGESHTATGTKYPQ